MSELRTRRGRAARAVLTAFALAAAVDLAALLAGGETGHAGHLIAKPLLLPLLAGHVVLRGGPRTLTLALLFGWSGDVLLLSDADPLFLAGMGGFAAGHVCYLVLFARHGGRTGSSVGGPVANSARKRTARAHGERPRLAAAGGAALVAVAAVAVALLWPDLPAGLRVPVAVYSLLLTAMASRAIRLGRLAGTGGVLFLLSDLLIATGIADWPQPPRPDFWIMLTYVLAQYALARGVLEARDTTARPAEETPAAPPYREPRAAS